MHVPESHSHFLLLPCRRKFTRRQPRSSSRASPAATTPLFLRTERRVRNHSSSTHNISLLKARTMRACDHHGTRFELTSFCARAAGAGKTHTMLGHDKDDPGIMARALNDLFLEMHRTREDMAYKVTMSYLEVRAPPPRGHGLQGHHVLPGGTCSLLPPERTWPTRSPCPTWRYVLPPIPRYAHSRGWVRKERWCMVLKLTEHCV